MESDRHMAEIHTSPPNDPMEQEEQKEEEEEDALSPLNPASNPPRREEEMEEEVPPSSPHHTPKRRVKKESVSSIEVLKDQLKVFTSQNTQLLSSLEALEEEADLTRVSKLALERGNADLRNRHQQLENQMRAVTAEFKQRESEYSTKDEQVKVLMSQNTELLGLLETEERQKLWHAQQTDAATRELDVLKAGYETLRGTAKANEELASSVSKKNHFRTEEIRLLRQELATLKSRHGELKMKMQVDVEALEKQLQARKDNQYKLVERVQSLEEGKRRAEEQVVALETECKSLHEKVGKLSAQLQATVQAKRSQEEEAQKTLGVLEGLRQTNMELNNRVDAYEQERLRMQEGGRKNQDQLQDMADKVFQLLGKLKLSELGKAKAVEVMRKTDQEVLAAKKATARLVKEVAKEAQARQKAETELKSAQDSVRALQKHNEQLSQRCKDEVNNKLKEQEKRKQVEEKLKIYGGKFSLLFDRYKLDKEEMRKMEVEIKTKTEVIRFLERKLEENSSTTVGPGGSSTNDALSSSMIPLSLSTSKSGLIARAAAAAGGGGEGGERGAVVGRRGGQGKEGEGGGPSARTIAVTASFPRHTKQLSAEKMREVLQRRRWNGRVGGLEPSLAWPASHKKA